MDTHMMKTALAATRQRLRQGDVPWQWLREGKGAGELLMGEKHDLVAAMAWPLVGACNAAIGLPAVLV